MMTYTADSAASLEAAILAANARKCTVPCSAITVTQDIVLAAPLAINNTLIMAGACSPEPCQLDGGGDKQVGRGALLWELGGRCRGQLGKCHGTAAAPKGGVRRQQEMLGAAVGGMHAWEVSGHCPPTCPTACRPANTPCAPRNLATSEGHGLLLAMPTSAEESPPPTRLPNLPPSLRLQILKVSGYYSYVEISWLQFVNGNQNSAEKGIFGGGGVLLLAGVGRGLAGRGCMSKGILWRRWRVRLAGGSQEGGQRLV